MIVHVLLSKHKLQADNWPAGQLSAFSAISHDSSSGLQNSGQLSAGPVVRGLVVRGPVVRLPVNGPRWADVAEPEGGVLTDREVEEYKLRVAGPARFRETGVQVALKVRAVPLMTSRDHSRPLMTTHGHTHVNSC